MTQERTKISKTLEKSTLISTQVERVEMQLNTEDSLASGLLIQRLTELYENPIEAAVRETVSNGMDAVMESSSGIRPEVWITSPTTLNPIFTVRDNGVGMTYNDIKNVYSKYGSSTKQNNFGQVGAYGLGAKAPLAYGTQFTVSSIKDGQKTVAIVAREEMTNYIEIIESKETSEPTGTTISIPVKSGDNDKFLDAIETYKRTPLEMNLDLYVDMDLKTNDLFLEVGCEIDLFEGDLETVTGKVWIQDGFEAVKILTSHSFSELKEKIAFVIGGWMYERPDKKARHLQNTKETIFVELKPGLVSFNSSRDSIINNERYQDLIERAVSGISSKSLMLKVVEKIEELDLKTFKKTIASTYSRNMSTLGNSKLMRDKDGVLNLESNLHNPIEIESPFNFVHKETGFSFKNLLVEDESQLGTSASVKFLKAFGDRSSQGYTLHPILRTDEADGALYNIGSLRKTSSQAKEEVELLLNANETGIQSRLGLNLFMSYTAKIYAELVNSHHSHSQHVGYKRSEVLLVTNSNAEKASNIIQWKNGILKELFNIDTDSSYQLELIFATHNEKYLRSKVKCLEEVTILSYEQIVEKLKDAKAKNKEKREEKEKTPLTTNLKLYKPELEVNQWVGENFTPTTKKTLVLMVKNEIITHIDSSHIANWYCNQNKVNLEDLTVLISEGPHKVTDFKILEEKGELFVLDRKDPVSNSKYYEDNYSKSIVGFNYFLDTEEDVEERAISYFIRASFNLKKDETMSTYFDNPFSGKFEELVQLNEVLPESHQFNAEMFDNLFESVEKILRKFPSGFNYKWLEVAISTSAEEHILASISKEKREFLELAFNLLSSSMGLNNRIAIFESHSIYSSESPRYLSYLEVEALLDKSNENSFVKKVSLEKAKMLVEEIKRILKIIEGNLK